MNRPTTFHETRFERLARTRRAPQLKVAQPERRRPLNAHEIMAKLPADPDRLYRDEPALGPWLVIIACYVAGWFLLRWLASAYSPVAVVLGGMAIILLLGMWIGERYRNNLLDARVRPH